MTPEPTRLSRRAMLTAAGGAAVGVALPAYLRPRGGLLVPRAEAAQLKPFKAELPIPEVLDDARLAIPMVEAEIPILPGRPTRMWTYGGSFPGPTIRRPSGERTTARFAHRLPKSAGELSVHLHGGHNRSSEDGQPGGLTRSQPRSLYCDISPGLSAADSGNDLLIAPGGARTYSYDFVEDGEPERAALHWYHDHRLDRTGRNVWRGLAGMWITDDGFEASLPLPRGNREIPLMLSDRAFDRRNQLLYRSSGYAPDDGVTGRHILVNGAVLPDHRVRACRHRIRVLNASNFRSYNLKLTGGAQITQIGTESGLMPAPIRRKAILLGPGERADLIVDFARARHSDVVLRSARRGDGPDRLGSRTYEGPLMQFRVGRPLADTTRIPARLRPLPEWVEEAPRSAGKAWRFTVGSGLRPSWLINGRTFDPAFAEARPRLGTTETWRLVNRTAVAHLIHLHHTDWYMISRNGKAPPPWERCLKETFFLDPGEQVEVAGRFSDHLGKYVVHCHMLEHEDHGLMSQFEVVA